MRKLKIAISIAASIDIMEIWEYTAKRWSVEQADRYYSLLEKEINHLANKPHFGKALERIRQDYLSSKVKSHYIFYRISKDEIQIIRILHESMDIPNRLED